MRKIMVTGGYGFIGSNFIRYWLDKYPEDKIINVDCMTYAANPAWLDSKKFPQVACEWSDTDIRSRTEVATNMGYHRPDHVIHFAAESHVCRSITGPEDFFSTNVMGTFNLIEEFKRLDNGGRFLHVSTDEVYGSLPLSLWKPERKFHEDRKYDPSSPYAASKAASDLLVMSYAQTYRMNVLVTHSTNNFGPNQHEEKLIPRTIKSFAQDKPVIIHGRGDHIRDWIWVGDHCTAIDKVFHAGLSGEHYLIGGENERNNLQVIMDIKANFQHMTGREIAMKITHTDDRPTDDARYGVETDKIRRLGWRPSTNYYDHLQETILWYLDKLPRRGGLGLEGSAHGRATTPAQTAALPAQTPHDDGDLT